MKVLIIGAGVIGSIYGWALSEAGHNITHYVRSGKKDKLKDGINIDVADTRKGKKKRHIVNYAAISTEVLSPSDSYDLVIIPVKQHQLIELLSQIANKTGSADYLIMTGNWHGTAEVDKILPQSRYIWGDTTVGGTYKNGILIAGIFSPVQLGEINGENTERLRKIAALFKSAGFKPEVPYNIIHAHWLQYALNAAMWSNFAASDSLNKLLRDAKAIDNTLFSIKEAFDVCIKRGVDLNDYPELKTYYNTTPISRFFKRIMLRYVFTFNEVVKRTSIQHALNGAEELDIIYRDIMKSSKEHNIPLPHLEILKDKVEEFIKKHKN